MNRVLQLQTLDSFGPTDLQSASSCSFLACGFCSSTSDSGCSGSEEQLNAI